MATVFFLHIGYAESASTSMVGFVWYGDDAVIPDAKAALDKLAKYLWWSYRDSHRYSTRKKPKRQIEIEFYEWLRRLHATDNNGCGLEEGQGQEVDELGGWWCYWHHEVLDAIRTPGCRIFNHDDVEDRSRWPEADILKAVGIGPLTAEETLWGYRPLKETP